MTATVTPVSDPGSGGEQDHSLPLLSGEEICDLVDAVVLNRSERSDDQVMDELVLVETWCQNLRFVMRHGGRDAGIALVMANREAGT